MLHWSWTGALRNWRTASTLSRDGEPRKFEANWAGAKLHARHIGASHAQCALLPGNHKAPRRCSESCQASVSAAYPPVTDTMAAASQPHDNPFQDPADSLGSVTPDIIELPPSLSVARNVSLTLGTDSLLVHGKTKTC